MKQESADRERDDFRMEDMRYVSVQTLLLNSALFVCVRAHRDELSFIFVQVKAGWSISYFTFSHLNWPTRFVFL